MSKERDRVPLSTEISPLEATLDPQSLDSARSKNPDDASGWKLADGRENAAPERLTSGQTLSGRYRIEHELGEGGMGVVYLATDEQVVGETFAVKVLKEPLCPEALAVLREEVHKSRRLSHPNIVDVHSVNVDGTKLYVLMEYLQGKSLCALLDEEFGRGMPLSHAWPIIEDAGAALGYAHDHNVIHSDLKPANIFVTTSGRTKLLDFGIARVSRGPLLRKLSGPLALTPVYASCEMLEGKGADPRDDVYSFACVIYEMLCGKRPFGDSTALQARETGARVPRLDALSRQQNAALSKALAFDRQARTPSVEKLLAGLVANQRPRTRANGVVAGTVLAAAAAGVLVYWAFENFLAPTHPPASATTTVTPFNPPPHSIAVLPFVNVSGSEEQDYFSNGLTEELLNSLSRINELQVAARTSSFSFQGEHPDIATVGHKLNVAAVLEGSVRRFGNTVRITAQLNNSLTGFQLWAQNYDRDLGDVLALQTEIADAVTSALKVTMLGDVGARIELGGTRNPTAFDAYLRGLKASNMVHNAKDEEAAIAAYGEAIRLDPGYALALAARSLALTYYADYYATGQAIQASYESAQADARLAVARAPALANGYLALANVLVSQSLDFAEAEKKYRRAVLLEPGNAQVAWRYGYFAAQMGQTDVGFAAIARAVQLDPLNPAVHRLQSFVFRISKRYQAAVNAAQRALALDPHNPGVLTTRGLAYYVLGDYENARESCESTEPIADPAGTYSGIQVCLAITYDKLGRHADAKAKLTTLQSWYGDRGAYQYAEIYSQWGDTPKALAWLEKALRLRDSGLVAMKVDELLDHLRDEPRFQALEHALKFPS